MESRFSRALLAVFIFLLLATPVQAHHSFAAEFDAGKFIAITGVLTKLEWSNPHIYFYVDVKEPNGAATTWTFEGSNTGPIKEPEPAGWIL